MDNVKNIIAIAEAEKPWIALAMDGERLKAVMAVGEKNPEWDLRTAKAFIDGLVEGAMHVAVKMALGAGEES